MKVLLLTLLIPVCSGIICPSNKYWAANEAKCLDCTKCHPHQLTVRPCQTHMNTECSSLSDINWPWLPKRTTLEEIEAKEFKEKSEHPDVDLKHKDKHHHKNKDKKFEEQFFEKKHKEIKHRQRVNSKKMRNFDPDTYDDDDYDDIPRLPKLHIHKHDRIKSNIMKHSDDLDLPSKKDEEELKKFLKQSQSTLKHRKDDLLKRLKEEHPDDDNSPLKLNHPSRKLDPKLMQDLYNHESHNNKTRNRQKSFSEEEDFESLVLKEEGKEPNLINIMAKPSKKVNSTPRQGKHLGKEEHHEKHHFPDDHADFTTAEKLVSDWQIVAFVSAIASCLLFFIVAITYTLLNTHQWRRVKIRYEVDPDEMSSKLALMNPTLETSASDGIATGRYLEHLIALHQLEGRKTNEYINEKQAS